MKQDILALLKTENGTCRLNNISSLKHWTTDGVDMLVIEFDDINGVHFGQWQVIRSRDYDGIIQECKDAIGYHLGGVIGKLCKDLED